MLNLTKEEKIVLLVLAFVLFLGSVIDFALKKFPEIKDIVNLTESQKIYPKMDINTASPEELESLPFIGLVTAKRIVDYRRDNGPFISLEDIKKVKGIKAKNVIRRQMVPSDSRAGKLR